MLRATDRPLSDAYDLAMLDLDGVVYVGGHAVPEAAGALEAARSEGMTLAFITNNAARPPGTVADHLVRLGIQADASDVVTSAQAAARLLAGRLRPGGRVFLVGADGLEQALVERGLTPVTELSDDPEAVVTGYGPEVPWRRIMQGAILVNRGLPWVASNTDSTIPTADGVGPGHGVLVRMLAEFTGVTPEVAGKPERPLLDETVTRVGGDRPLMVGDRLDTDILGARRAGLDSLLVMTGVTGLAELADAPAEERPTYVACDLRGLLQSQPETSGDDSGWRCGGWQASVADGVLGVTGAGSADDWWRAVAEACWHHLDDTGTAARTDDTTPPGAEDRG